MEKTDLMKEYEIRIDSIVNWEAHPIGYTRYIESELLKARLKAEAYDRIMSGGKKTLKEWANIFGMPIAVDHDGEASSFAHVPVIHLDDGEGIWGNNPEHYGEETYLLPPHLIDFDGDWKDSLTLPDGWEELCSHST